MLKQITWAGLAAVILTLTMFPPRGGAAEVNSCEQLFSKSVQASQLRLRPYRAVFTGSFDPVTTNHLTLIRAIALGGVSRLTVMVNENGGSKKDYKASSRERAEMLRLALADLSDKIEVIVVRRTERDRLTEELRGNDPFIYKLIGGDSFNSLSADELAEPNRLLILIPRVGSELPFAPGQEPANVTVFPMPELGEGSSTRLRADLANGNYGSPLLHPRVRDYVRAHNLYQSVPPELVVIRKAEFSGAFAKFMRELKAALPNLNLSGIEEPPFEPTQSREARDEKFIEWILKKTQLTGPDAQNLRAIAVTLLFTTSSAR